MKSSAIDVCKRSVLPAVAVLCGVLSLLRGLETPINDDDIYHLHSIWLVSKGAVPYHDFFEVHLPGMWILASPLGWLARSAAGLFLTGRVLTAIMFGLTVFLGGLLVRARGLQALLVGLLCIASLEKCNIYLFRTEYVTTLLLMLHFWLLTRIEETGTKGRCNFFAAVVIALACTMSIRPAAFLPVQPILILVLRRRINLPKQVSLYCLGVVVGILPCAVFLAVHNLWAEAWFWAFQFVSSVDVMNWRTILGGFTWRRIVFSLIGFTATAALLFERRLRFDTRIVLGTAWLLGFGFFIIDPHRLSFAYVPLVILTALMISILPLAVSRWLSMIGLTMHESRLRGVCWAVFLTAALAVAGYSFRFQGDRTIQRSQLELLNWLQHVCHGEPAVLVVPHHPIVVRDATDIQNAWHYLYWINKRHVRERLSNVGTELLQKKPPVICTDPWIKRTGGRDLIEWLAYNNILGAKQVEEIREMIMSDYVQVLFPTLADLPYGHVFWVRKNRVNETVIPQPYSIIKPIFSSVE